MRNTILLLFITLSLSAFAGKQVDVFISFENQTDIPFESGELIITQWKGNPKITRTIQINSLDDVTLQLERGKSYNFELKTEEFLTKISFPYRIGKDSEVMITLNQEQTIVDVYANHLTLNDLHREDLEEYILEEHPFLYYKGSDVPKEKLKAFADKYGITIENSGPQMNLKKNYNTYHHNLVIYSYLNKKYGKEWQEDLPVEPYQHKALMKAGL